MKVWWVLVWDACYPSGHLGNVHSTWATQEEAEAKVEELKNKEDDFASNWYGAVNIEAVNIKDML